MNEIYLKIKNKLILFLLLTILLSILTTFAIVKDSLKYEGLTRVFNFNSPTFYKLLIYILGFSFFTIFILQLIVFVINDIN